MIAQYSALYPAQTRRTTLLLLALLIAAALAIGWATQAIPLATERTEQTIAGSKGENAGAGRDSSLAGSAGASSKAGRESARTSAPEELFRIAGSAGAKSKIVRESA